MRCMSWRQIGIVVAFVTATALVVSHMAREPQTANPEKLVQPVNSPSDNAIAEKVPPESDHRSGELIAPPPIENVSASVPDEIIGPEKIDRDTFIDPDDYRPSEGAEPARHLGKEIDPDLYLASGLERPFREKGEYLSPDEQYANNNISKYESLGEFRSPEDGALHSTLYAEPVSKGEFIEP